MKILFIENNYARSGPVNQLINLVKGLDKKKFKLEILYLIKKKNFHKIKTHARSLPKGFFSIFFLLKLKRKINLIQPDVIHVNSSFRCLLYTYILNLKNVVFVLRNDPKIVWSDNYGMINQIILKNLYLILLSKVNLICCSKFLFDKYAHYSTKKKFIIYNSVKKQNEKKKSKGKTFLVLSRIIKTKNIFFLVNAFKSLKELSNYNLFIAGEGNLQRDLKLFIGNTCKNIKYLGYKRNVDKLFKLTDYNLSASITEGFPNSVLEALSRKIPAILSDIPQHQEIYKSEKLLKKLIFKNNSKKSLLRAINFLIKNEKIIKKKIDRINNKFSLKNMIKSYEKVYLKINEK